MAYCWCTAQIDFSLTLERDRVWFAGAGSFFSVIATLTLNTLTIATGTAKLDPDNGSER